MSNFSVQKVFGKLIYLNKALGNNGPIPLPAKKGNNGNKLVEIKFSFEPN